MTLLWSTVLNKSADIVDLKSRVLKPSKTPGLLEVYKVGKLSQIVY